VASDIADDGGAAADGSNGNDKCWVATVYS